MKNKNNANMFQKNIKKFLNNKLAIIGLIAILIITIASILAPIITSYNPSAIDFAKKSLPPNSEHIFGTDKLGRDILSRVLYGGRISILIGVTGAFAGSIIGAFLGGIAGYYGKMIDSFLIRVSEIFQTFPQMVLILIMVAMLGQGTINLLIIFSITGWMTTFRMVRNEFLTLREETYVKVCESFGMSKINIIFKQILPNVMSPIIVATTINIAGFILQEAGLSFLGVGVPSDVPTWGNILNAAKSIDVIQNYWWLWLIPGTIISIFVLAINFLGDGLRDVLDPKQQ